MKSLKKCESNYIILVIEHCSTVTKICFSNSRIDKWQITIIENKEINLFQTVERKKKYD